VTGQEADRILHAVGQALAQALQVSGIGGKTRLGYGRFEGTKGRSDKVTR